MSDEIGDSAFGVQVSIGLVGKVLTQVAGFVGSVALARVLGPGGYGLFYVALGIAKFFENPATGWAAACRKRLAETDFDTGEAVGSTLLAVLAMALVGGPVSYGVLTVLSGNAVIPLAVPLLFVPVSIYLSMTQLLASRRNFALVEWGSVVRTVLKITFQIGLVVAGLEVWGMVGGTIAASLLTVPLVYRWLDVRPAVPSTESLVSVARYARWSVPGRFLGTGLSRMDVILLGWLATAGAAGMYQVALKLAMPAALVSAAVGTGLLGRISNLESRDEEWHTDYRNALSMESLLAVPIFFGSVVLSEGLIVTVFSAQYEGAGVFLVGLALYKVLDTQTSPRESVLNALDRPDVVFWTSLAALAINVSLGVGLLLLYGPVGIVLATVITQAFTYTARTVAVRMLTDAGTVVTRPFLEQVLAGAVMAALVRIGTRVVGPEGWHVIVALVAFGGVIYFGVLLAFSSYFRSTVRGIYSDFREQYRIV